MLSQPNILLADDEPVERGSLSLLLKQEGYRVTAVEDGLAALELLEKQQFDIVLADVRMPRMTGIELLKQIKEKEVDAEVILITAYGEIKDAVEATKAGAYNFVEKDHNIDEELKLTISRAIERLELIRENRKLRQNLNHKNRFYQLIGKSKQMQEMYEIVEMVADSKASVLIQGETGTGKDLVARAIHEKSSRAKAPFVKINCAIPEELLESEMFGHVKGAFTSAYRSKEGKFEAADGGTVFLDDIDTFPPELQVKLLRVIQDQSFERVGCTETIEVDVRIIAASNRDLQKLMDEGEFRADLFYRLNVVPIHISPLRERPGDIMLLANHFLRKYNAINNKTIEGFSDDAIKILMEHQWPGNVRELENVVERAVIMAGNSYINSERLMLIPRSSMAEFLAPGKRDAFPSDQNSAKAEDVSLKEELNDTEKEIIIAALERNKWQRRKTADELNISRVTLYNKMKKYGITAK